MPACYRFSKGALQQHLREQGFGVNVSAVSEQDEAGECEERQDEAGHCTLPSLRAKRSNPEPQSKTGLLRGACHRARIRATRWLAMTMLMTTLRKSRARPWGTGSRARLGRSGGTPPPYRSAS